MTVDADATLKSTAIKVNDDDRNKGNFMVQKTLRAFNLLF